MPRLLKEFHDHRLGATIEDAQYHDAERDFFDDVVSGADARRDEIDTLIGARLAEGWSLERLDRPMRAILRAGAYELIARRRRARGLGHLRICRCRRTPSTTSARAASSTACSTR